MFEDNEPWPFKCVSCAKEFGRYSGRTFAV